MPNEGIQKGEVPIEKPLYQRRVSEGARIDRAAEHEYDVGSTKEMMLARPMREYTEVRNKLEEFDNLATDIERKQTQLKEANDKVASEQNPVLRQRAINMGREDQKVIDALTAQLTSRKEEYDSLVAQKEKLEKEIQLLGGNTRQ